MVITWNDEKAINDLKAFLNSCFKIKDLGLLTYFLGIEVTCFKAGITICQCKYTLDILEEVRLLGATLAKVPMEPDMPSAIFWFSLDDVTEPNDSTVPDDEGGDRGHNGDDETLTFGSWSRMGDVVYEVGGVEVLAEDGC
ncbi:hypothetical protein ACLB2K_066724 [Fragaria x ananassa]